jgi:hypothetical protein
MDVYPDLEFAEAVKKILNEQAHALAAATDDEMEFYEQVGDLIVQARKDTDV